MKKVNFDEGNQGGIDSAARLTWDIRAPAPFESAWNLLIKIQLLNAIDSDELKRLGKIDFRAGDPHRLFNSPADWDIARIASCLRVDPARVRNGFLECLGFPVQERARYAVRHCPDCSALNYHCTLFNLPFLSRCPWHDKELTSGCERCGWLPFRWRWRVKAELLRWECPDCGHVVDLGSNLCVNRIAVETEDEIRTHCQQLMNWWSNVREAAGDASSLLDPLAYKMQPLDYDRMWRLNWASGVSAPPVKWGVVPATLNAGVLVRLPGNDSPQFNRVACSRAHRLVEKCIFRRFISGHAECLSELMAMGPFDRISLDCSTICTVCVAFLSWRSAHEGRLPSNELRADQMPVRRLREVPPSGNSSKDSKYGVLSFLHFVWIWAQIEERPSVSAFRIIASRRESEPMYFPHVLVKGEREVVVCVIPSVTDFLEIATKRCAKRRSSNVPMAHPAAVYANSGWNAVVDESVLFAARNHQPHQRNSYHYIYV